MVAIRKGEVSTRALLFVLKIKIEENKGICQALII
jgi:hypothetical protein